jgi:hypothetical protein
MKFMLVPYHCEKIILVIDSINANFNFPTSSIESFIKFTNIYFLGTCEKVLIINNTSENF